MFCFWPICIFRIEKNLFNKGGQQLTDKLDNTASSCSCKLCPLCGRRNITERLVLTCLQGENSGGLECIQCPDDQHRTACLSQKVREVQLRPKRAWTVPGAKQWRRWILFCSWRVVLPAAPFALSPAALVPLPASLFIPSLAPSVLPRASELV